MPRLSQGARLDRLFAETRGRDRYQDIAMIMRRPMVRASVPLRGTVAGDKPENDVPGDLLIVNGVRLRVLSDAQPGQCVPVASEIIAESGTLAAGSVAQRDGQSVGVFDPVVLVSAGGVWDHFGSCWRTDVNGARVQAADPVVLDLQESQVEYARWFVQNVLLPWRAGQLLTVSCSLAIGGRRAGKTWLLNMLLWAISLDRPRLTDGSPVICWQISVSYREKAEIDDQIKKCIPKEWYTFAVAQNIYTLRNGGTIHNISARNPASLRRGRADIQFLNEAQKVPRRVFVNAIPATADRGGILLMASNQATEEDAHGEWIYDLQDAWSESGLKGEAPPLHVHNFDFLDNHAISMAARSRSSVLVRIVDPDAAAADDQSTARPVGLLALWAFDRHAHIRPLPPDAEDITEQYTAQHRLLRKAYPYLAGADFQISPHNALSVFKVFGTIERPILYCVDVFTIVGDEDDLIDEMEQAGYGPGDLAIIGDCSGGYQDSSHNFASGRTSFAYFKNRGYKILPVREPRDPKSKTGKNPDVPRSLTQTNTWLKDGRFFIVEGLDPAVEVAKRCKAKKKDGGLYPADRKHGHVLDTWRYPIYWLTPPKKATVATSRPHTRVSPNWRERKT